MYGQTIMDISCSICTQLFINPILFIMEGNDKKQQPQSAANEEYDVNHPENLNTPKFNSTSEHRDTNELPGVENLNLENAPNEAQKPENDSSLRGTAPKTDLGNGQRDDDENEKEKIIRT